jgi:stage IV sporulation protein FB
MRVEIPGRIPITITPMFWLFAGLIGLLNSGFSVIGMVVWMGIIFVSVLFHEMGHALTAKWFGLQPQIELVALGGVTHHDAGKLPYWKQFLIVLNGPLFGFILFIATWLLQESSLIGVGIWHEIVRTCAIVNLFWTVLNLLPVLPLDGGQLLRIVLERFFGTRGVRYSLLIGVVLATVASLSFFVLQQMLIGAIFFLLAFQGYVAWKQSKVLTAADQGEEVRHLFDQAEIAFHEGRKQQAVEGFQQVRARVGSGILYNLSTQFLAFLKLQEGEREEAYNLLLPIRPQLSEESLCLLHRVAFDMKNYKLVSETAGLCFQRDATVEAAVRNAMACAALGNAACAVGWLQTALSEGLDNLPELLKDPIFDLIRNTDELRTFVAQLKK